MTREERIVVEARGMLGMECRYRGASRAARGIDCAEFVVDVGAAAGAIVPTGANKFRAKAIRQDPRPVLLQYLDVAGDREPTNGSVVVFLYGRYAHHLAIAADGAGGPTMIHAFDKAGRVVENRIDTFWKSRIIFVLNYRWPEVV